MSSLNFQCFKIENSTSAFVTQDSCFFLGVGGFLGCFFWGGVTWVGAFSNRIVLGHCVPEVETLRLYDTQRASRSLTREMRSPDQVQAVVWKGNKRRSFVLSLIIKIEQTAGYCPSLKSSSAFQECGYQPQGNFYYKSGIQSYEAFILVSRYLF